MHAKYRNELGEIVRLTGRTSCEEDGLMMVELEVERCMCTDGTVTEGQQFWTPRGFFENNFNPVH